MREIPSFHPGLGELAMAGEPFICVFEGSLAGLTPLETQLSGTPDLPEDTVVKRLLRGIRPKSRLHRLGNHLTAVHPNTSGRAHLSFTI